MLKTKKELELFRNRIGDAIDVKSKERFTEKVEYELGILNNQYANVNNLLLIKNAGARGDEILVED